MTKEEIYKMVKKSDLGFLLGDNWMMHHEFERFAALVASAEREACAKVCEDLDAWDMDDPASTAAKAIRARGQA